MNSNLLPLHQKINQRVGHIAVPYKGKLLVWGGYMEFSDPSESETHHHATDELFVYETHSELWERKLLKGDIPPRSSGGCGVVLGDTLYIFGGKEIGVVRTEFEFDGNINDLYALNLITMTWSLLKPKGTPPIPCEKLVGWEHGGKLYFFGGFGPIPDRHVFFHYVIDDETGSAWNNQFFGYNPITNNWEWPYVNGEPPSPRAAHAGDKCGHRIFISGGRLKTVRKNDLYVLDMDTMVWSGNINESAEYVPPGRSWHSFTFISPHRAVLYGGFSTYNNVLNDCWFVDILANEENLADECATINERRWKVQYILPPHAQRFCLRRFWHKTVFLEKTGDLICFGGFNRFNNPPLIVIHGDDEESVQDQDLKPVNDCWILEIPDISVEKLPSAVWREYKLPYDFGEPRCAHAACIVGISFPESSELEEPRMVIVGGLTQPFYETAMKLKDHTNVMLTIHFRPLTLLRLSLNATLKYHKKNRNLWETLPHSLQALLNRRFSQIYP
ncbi:Kelch domain-containing protein 1 [Frankliniella fusca]|uniref:Kelch domain-containing protein 1 n=1 Tax=Frankliniella fusca TaxID=407009 RepID=A0AAE1H4T8_9NEOP|nr:Kelch domain-containing protein 1 [Frankliniella fusca]